MIKLNRTNLLIIIILAILASIGLLFFARRFFVKQITMDDTAIQKVAGNEQIETPPVEQESGLIEKAIDFAESKLGLKEDEKNILDPKTDPYFLHKNITSTIFWVGEKAGDDNDNISNSPSAWDEKWKKHYGGTDSPDKRNVFYPSKFIPKENPFYAALPYNDFNAEGKRKKNVSSIIPWSKEKQWDNNESMCKNRWIKIKKEEKVAYAQWEDVGPFEENDGRYVFGKSEPKSEENKSAGIDLSPAVRDFLNLRDIDKVNWQFIEEKDVPEGPWKKIITHSNINW